MGNLQQTSEKIKYYWLDYGGLYGLICYNLTLKKVRYKGFYFSGRGDLGCPSLTGNITFTTTWYWLTVIVTVMVIVTVEADKQLQTSRWDPPLMFLYPHQWWNRMRSSCWNAPVVSVLLGLIAGVCWASHGHTGLASDPKQLLSRQGLQLRRSSPKNLHSLGQANTKTGTFKKHGSDPQKVSTLQ